MWHCKQWDLLYIQGQQDCPLMVQPLFVHHSKQCLYTWMGRIGHPPSVGGTLPRNNSFIINGGGVWAVHRGLKAVARGFPPHQKEHGEQHVPSDWVMFFLSDCRVMFNSTLTSASMFVFFFIRYGLDSPSLFEVLSAHRSSQSGEKGPIHL